MLRLSKDEMDMIERHLRPWLERRDVPISLFRGLKPHEKDSLHEWIYKKAKSPEFSDLIKLALKLQIVKAEARGEGLRYDQIDSEEELMERFLPTDEEHLRRY